MSRVARAHWCGLLLATAILAGGCAHQERPVSPDVELGPQERIMGMGFSVARPAGFRVTTENDRRDGRIARVLDAGGLAFLATASTGDPHATAFVLPGGAPFPATPTPEFCREMAEAFLRRGNSEDLRLGLDGRLGDGGCSVSFRSADSDGGKRQHRGLFFAARGQTWQLQTTSDAAVKSPQLEEALETLVASWQFERLPVASTSTFEVDVPAGFFEAADQAATTTRERGGVMWVAEQAPVSGIIVASISIAPAVGATVPVTEESCRSEMKVLDKTARGVEVSGVTINGRQTCRAQGSDPSAPERQLSITLVEVGTAPLWLLCRYHAVDDDAALTCEAVAAKIRAPSASPTASPSDR